MRKKEKFEAAEVISGKIGKLMQEKKAKDIKILDVRGITSMTDFFVICSSDSHPQTKAISDHIEDELLKDGIKPWHIEGYANREWILMDYINIVVNIFSLQSREYYNLERLWGDAVITEVEEETA